MEEHAGSDWKRVCLLAWDLGSTGKAAARSDCGGPSRTRMACLLGCMPDLMRAPCSSLSVNASYCSPDGQKKAYVCLTADYDALDVANKIGII